MTPWTPMTECLVAVPQWLPVLGDCDPPQCVCLCLVLCHRQQRAQDTEKSNPADTAFCIAAYVRRIQTRFLEGACVRTGFTHVMLQTVRKAVVYIVRGTPLQSGHSDGATPADVQFCLEKMQCWAPLAIATACAEFPDVTVMHAMPIFNLHSADLASGDRHLRGSVVDAGNAQVLDKLQTMAPAFTLDVDELSSQYFDTRDIAQAVAGMNSGVIANGQAAWRSALLRCKQVAPNKTYRFPRTVRLQVFW